MEKLTINGIAYVPESEAIATKNGLKFCIIRSTNAGVFAGYVESREGQEVVLRDAIRIWKWAGAASLSQLAMEGVKDPDNCKFAMPVARITVLEVIEVIECTQMAQKNIQEVESWKE